MCYLNVPDNPGTTGFVYICPGQREDQYGRPCAGQTGTMLDRALPYLQGLRPRIFPYLSRYEYLITNAWPEVEYPGQDKRERSVPKAVEVASMINIEGLYGEIAHLKHVVACGDLAHLATKLWIEFLGLEGRVAYVKHTSSPALGCPTREQLDGAVQGWAISVAEYF
jgi:hypothetical protein